MAHGQNNLNNLTLFDLTGLITTMSGIWTQANQRQQSRELHQKQTNTWNKNKHNRNVVCQMVKTFYIYLIYNIILSMDSS